MPRQHHEVVLDRPIAEAFSMLVNVLARGRWRTRLLLEPAHGLPGPGMRYEQQRGSVLRRGRVIECIRPVSVTLQETLHDPPCRVELKLRWRLEPADAGSRVRLLATFELAGAAAFRRRHWESRIHAHCGRMMHALERCLGARDQEAGSFDSGQKIGSRNITAKNVTSDSGTPTFR